MGWISDFFGGGDDVETTTTIAQQEIPGYIQDYSKENLDLGAALAERDFQSYDSPLTQGFNQTQLDAFDASTANQGAWQPMSDAAMNTAGGVAGGSVLNANMQGYQNPYLNSQKTAVNRNFDIAQQGVNSNAVNSSAFGNDRRGITDAELGTNRAQALSTVDSDAFKNAQDMYFKDQQSRLQGAGVLDQMAGNYQNRLGRDVGAQALYGGQQQAQGQKNIDANYAQFQRELAYPMEMFNLRQSALTGTPYATGTATTQSAPAQSNFAANTGAIGGLVSGVGSLFTTPGGTSGGGKSAWNSIFNP